MTSTSTPISGGPNALKCGLVLPMLVVVRGV